MMMGKEKLSLLLFIVLLLYPVYACGKPSLKSELRDLEGRVSDLEIQPSTTQEQIHRYLISTGMPQQMEHAIKVLEEISKTGNELKIQQVKTDENIIWLVSTIKDHSATLAIIGNKISEHDSVISVLSVEQRKTAEKLAEFISRTLSTMHTDKGCCPDLKEFKGETISWREGKERRDTSWRDQHEKEDSEKMYAKGAIIVSVLSVLVTVWVGLKQNKEV